MCVLVWRYILILLHISNLNVSVSVRGMCLCVCEREREGGYAFVSEMQVKPHPVCNWGGEHLRR